MQAYVEQVIGNDSHHHIGHQSDYHHQQIAPVAPHQPYEGQQDEEREQRAPHQLVQLIGLLLRCIVYLLEIHSALQFRYNLFHPLVHLLGTGYDVVISLHVDVHVDGVQPVDPEVSVRFHVLVFIGGQVVEIHHLVGHHTYGHLLQRLVKPLGSQIDGVALVVPRLLHFAHHIVTAQKGFYATLQIACRQSVSCQHHGVVGDDYILVGAAGHLHLLHLLHLLQLRFHVGVDVFPQLFVRQVGVHLVGLQQLCGILASALVDHLTAREFGVGDTFGQLAVGLPEQRGYLKFCGRHIGIGLQVYSHAAAAEVRLRTHFFHSTHHRHQSLYPGCHILLHHLG